MPNIQQERGQLGDPKPPSQTQLEYNRQFPLDRRENMIANAEQDQLGRPVVYYRTMHEKIVQILSQRGSISGQVYFEGHLPQYPYHLLNEPIQIQELLYMFADKSEYLGSVSPRLIEEYEDQFKDGKLTGSQIAKLLIPDISQEDLELFDSDITYQQAIELTKKYLDKDYLLSVHTGSAKQKFSDRLSLHVGGVPDSSINSQISDHAVRCVELVIPSQYVSPHPGNNVGEKEVSVEELKVGWITRIFYDEEQFKREVLENPKLPIGQFIATHQPAEYEGDPANTWAWEEPTENCLPTNLIDEYHRLMRKLFPKDL